MIDSNLVDFKTLSGTQSLARRNELLRGVATLFAFASERCTAEQLDIYDDVLGRLVDMVEDEALAFAAEKLAPLRRTPPKVVRRLAGTAKIAIAGPVLRKSPVLTEQDLLHLAEIRDQDHLVAIAERYMVPAPVSDVVVRRGEDVVRRTIAGNQGAVLGNMAMAELVRFAMSDVETATALGRRSDTPESVIAQLVDHATDSVRRALGNRGFAVADQGLARAASVAEQRMTNAFWLSQYDFETSWERLHQQGGSKIVSEPMLGQYAVDDRFADVVAVFALLAGLGLEEVKHWLVRTDPEPFLVMSKALGLRFSTVQNILRCGPWRSRLGQDERRDALTRYMAIDVRQARAQFAAWQQVRLAS